MELEFAVRGAAASFATAPAADPKRAADSLALPIPDAPHPTFLQTSAADIASASAPSWAHGMVTRATALASSHGVPGRLLSVDPIALIAVRRGAGGPAIAYIGAPREAPVAVGGKTRYRFGAGSIWITATLLAATAPGDGFMGVKATALELLVPGPPPAGPPGGDIVVPPTAVAKLRIDPAPPDPATGFVNDGSATTCTLPAHIDLRLSPSGIDLIGLSDAAFSTLGATVALSGGPAGTAWDADASEIVFSYASATPATFAAAGTSTVGRATTLAGQYRLPVARARPDRARRGRQRWRADTGGGRRAALPVRGTADPAGADPVARATGLARSACVD